MQLIKDLGMKENSSGSSYRLGEYLCKNCNTVHELYTHNVKAQEKRSIELFDREAICKNCTLLERNIVHGLSGTKAYSTWKNMMNRCYSKSYKGHSNYGDRGITVCEEWHIAEIFTTWFNVNYTDGYQLDRRDNDLGYSPDNCRFITSTENIHNSRPKLNKIGKYRYVVWHKRSQTWRAVFKGVHIASCKLEDEAYNKLREYAPYIKYTEEIRGNIN